MYPLISLRDRGERWPGLLQSTWITVDAVTCRLQDGLSCLGTIITRQMTQPAHPHFG